MTLVPTCPRCDALTDPYGRDGGNSLCLKCLDEQIARDLRFTIELQQQPKRAA